MLGVVAASGFPRSFCFSKPFLREPLFNPGEGGKLRGPAAILFISRDTCSDSIAKLSRACFYGVSRNYRAIRCKMGYRMDVSVLRLSTKGGVSHYFGGVLTSLKKYRAIWGIAAIVSQYRAIWGH